ncbi:MAG: type 4a pilus biogenesis protein PilO [Patescibacteria group bacterium]|jgi:Tfp pilus assembly protein PilO
MEFPDYRQYLIYIPQPIRARGRDFAAVTASLFLTAFFLFFAIRPTVNAIAELLGEIKARERSDVQLQEKIDQIIKAQNFYNQIYDRLFLVEEALPKNPQIASLAKEIEAQRLKENLDLSKLGYSSLVLTDETGGKDKKKEAANLTPINFTLNMAGQYLDFKDFLKNVFEQRRIVHINNFEIQQAKEEETIKLDISLSGNTFYLNYHGDKTEQQ